MQALRPKGYLFQKSRFVIRSAVGKGDHATYPGTFGLPRRARPVEIVLLAAPERLDCGAQDGSFEARKEHRIQRRTDEMIAVRQSHDLESGRKPIHQLASSIGVAMVLGIAVYV